MLGLPSRAIGYTAESSEGTLFCPSTLLLLGSRAAVDQAPSPLARKHELLEACKSIYFRAIQTRFGPRPPAVDKVLASLTTPCGETSLPCGGTAANARGLTTQVPVD